MIVIAEINYRGNVHEMVNSCMVDIVRRIFPREQICLVGEASQIANLQKLSNADNLIVKDLYSELGGKPDPNPSRLKSLWRVLTFAKRQKAEYVFLLSLLPVGGACLRLLRPLFPRQKVLAVLHGELEHLRRGKGEKDYKPGRLLRFALHTGGKTRFIVLGGSIRRNLVEQFPWLDHQQVIAIDHPYHYPQLGAPKPAPNPVNFVQFGVGSISKGTEGLFASAEKVKREVSPESRFYIAGGVYPELKPWLDDRYVIYPQPGINLSRAEIDDIAAQCHYALFYYTNEHYKLCASGAFFDAVRYELPIVCLRNDFFAYYFEKYGPLGYLADSMEELDAILLRLSLELPTEEYSAQVENLKYLKNELQINVIAMHLDNALLHF
ncbi:MAG: hypothetical protein LBU95_04805 [Rikenellaceae bacterium]|jgi:hypothetical protein|nr:hypothetical protein [Rikenellaceae bacterium]